MTKRGPLACILSALACIAVWAILAGQAQAAPCGPEVYEHLRAPAGEMPQAVRVACDLDLDPSDVIARKIVFAGEQSSGTTLDCHGATIGTAAMKSGPRAPTIAIRSVPKGRGDAQIWSAPRDITIRNCTIVGSLRLIGLGPNGEAEAVHRSSLTRDHTRNAQNSAPSGIVLDRLKFRATGGIPLYFGPGVTRTSLRNSRFLGTTEKTAIYLDAESAGNNISRNIFAMSSVGRELIAVDGSARNVIANNTFRNPENGGIYVYRNCGEGGTIRHQKPQYNEITGNRFIYKEALTARPAIWLNQRDIGKIFCSPDPKYPFGSSLDSSDQAKHNIVRNNRFEGPWSLRIVNFDDTNRIVGNK
ncbi:right-handed parallel beta-helix repeat-containing protein [Agrobacterium sp. a22-2]|uniref:right-handed parallel beta-helix repeat-containing protein n=1 Tax=Agrobacterium sp. a22-2 TaxID=2283840 RepID=UPI001446AA94|nr:right-handed parallel beta-helix repeat-containing protein [Agrobacterium sp. a22-2]NKN35151.1 right-handed parallel beta-helix repeat-containing protein [Agrobacterium sp. a22-2]